MKIEPVKKEDLLTELGHKSRLIRLTVEKNKTITCEVDKMAVANVIQSKTGLYEDEFFFKIIEEEDNEQD